MSSYDALLKSIDSMSDSDKNGVEELGYTCSDDYIIINEDCTIKSRIPIDMKKSDITICRSEELAKKCITPIVRLIATEKYQPCIGACTNAGLSYGRYQISSKSVKSITIDGCIVICESQTPNFTLGVFGIEAVPDIILCNGGSIDCPETKGQRYMSVCPEPLEGSTKHSRYAQYVIVKPGEDIRNHFNDDIKTLIEEIDTLCPNISKLVTIHTSEGKLKKAIEVLKIAPVLDVTPLVNGEWEHIPTYILRSCVLLGLSENCYNSAEFMHEVNKWKELAERYNLPDGMELRDISKHIINKAFASRGYSFNDLNDFQKENVYELIPVYLFNFSEKSNHQCAEEWWKELGFK